MKPPNEKGALLHAPISKLAASHYHASSAAQACFPRWQREAARDCSNSFGALAISGISPRSLRMSVR
jgi:hypothetical protein